MARAARQPAPVAIVQLHMELEWVEPIVWRQVQIPATITLGRLHRVIQTAMGWTDSHLHEFILGDEHYGIPDEDDDLLPYPVRPERRARLDTVLLGRRYFDYIYDFGDHWNHKLRIEAMLPPAVLTHPVCVDGANACPPEDVGGAPGYEDLLRIIQDPSDPEHEDMIEWSGGSIDPTAFDINRINRLLMRIKL